MVVDQFICTYSKLISNADNLHFIISNPIKLECGHLICQKCYEEQTYSKTNLTCAICGHVSSCVFTLWNRTINLKEHLEIMKKEVKTQFQSRKSCLKQKKEFIRGKIRYLKGEIDVRVESIKIELDKEADRLKEELDLIKKELDSDKFNEANYHVLDNEESQESENEIEVIENDLYMMQEKISEIRKSIYELDAKLSNYQINEDFVSVDNLLIQSFDHKLKRSISSLPKFQLDYVNDACVLKGDEFCVIFDENAICIYNKYYKQTNGTKFDNCNFYGVTCDPDNNIYVIDGETQSILKLNYALELIGLTNFDKCTSYIHYYNDHIYVIGSNNMLYKLRTDLEYVSSHKVDGNRYRFLNNVLCTTNHNVHFYNIETFDYKFQYHIQNEDVSCFIIDTNFVVNYRSLDSNLRSHNVFNFYDSNGYYLTTIKLNYDHMSPNLPSFTKVMNFNDKKMILCHEQNACSEILTFIE